MKKKIRVKRKLKPKLSNKKNSINEIKDYMNNTKDFKILMMTKNLIMNLILNTTLCNYSFIMQLKIKLLTG